MTEATPTGLADHAEDFARRYAEELEIATGQVMIDLGLAPGEMGARDATRDLDHHAFYPHEGDCGSVNRVGQLNVDWAS